MSDYCTTTDLTNLTNSSRPTAQLQALIDDASREIDSYLATAGVVSTDANVAQSAALKLSQAGLLLLGLQDGSMQATSSDFSSSVNVRDAVQYLRSEGFKILDLYIERQLVLKVPRRSYVVRAN